MRTTTFIVILMAISAILLNVYAMGRDGFNPDKMSICIWSFNTMVWCIVVRRLS